MSTQVLIGTGDPEVARSLMAKLDEVADIHVIGVQQVSGDVMSVAGTEPQLDAVLIDENLGPLPYRDLVREIAMQHPHLAIILLVEELTQEVFMQAMEAGARSVVGRDPTLEELQARISSAAEWSRTMRQRLVNSSQETPISGRRGTILALCGGKGGTGTTTLAVQLAFAAAQAKRSVCLIDMDLQTGDVPGFLDLTHRRSIADLVEVSDDITGTMLADTLYVHPLGPHILLAPPECERAEEVTARAARNIVGAIRNRYEHVIIDCGAFMTEGNVMAVEMADRTVITVTPDLPALRSGKRLVKMWSRLQVRKEEEVEAVLVRHSKRNEIQPDFAAKILGLKLLKTTIPAAFRSLEKSVNTGSPNGVDGDGMRRALRALGREVGVIAPDMGRDPAVAAVAPGDAKSAGGKAAGKRAKGRR